MTRDKRRALQRYMREQGWDELDFAAGDTLSDLPLLEKAHKAVVVNPGEHLALLALKHGWEIIQAKHGD